MEIAIVCVRALIDVEAIAYIVQESAQISPLPTADRIREAAALLRRLREAWIAIGSHAQAGVRISRARTMLQQWRTQPPADDRGDATLVTLLVQSSTALVLNGTASSVEDARSQLEALSNAYAESAIEAELLAPGHRVMASDALVQMRDPPMHEVVGPPAFHRALAA